MRMRGGARAFCQSWACLLLLLLLLATLMPWNISAFRPAQHALLLRTSRAHSRSLLQPRMSILDSVLPLCIQATSKTTTVNDPLAGMDEEQITNYISNVGGGMCGLPDIVRTSIGFGLNLSLIVFGIFTISYVVLGGLNFALEKDIEGLIEEVQGGKEKGKSFADIAQAAWDAPINTPPNPALKGMSGGGGEGSREARRMKARIGKNDKN